MDKHKELVSKAKNAITSVFSDTSVDSGTTISSLRELKEEIEVLIDAVKTNKE